jgi:hypothetical protein
LKSFTYLYETVGTNTPLVHIEHDDLRSPLGTLGIIVENEMWDTEENPNPKQYPQAHHPIKDIVQGETQDMQQLGEVGQSVASGD